MAVVREIGGTGVSVAVGTSAAVVRYGESRPRSVSDIARQPFWTASEAAMVLRCNVRTLRTELRRGTLTGVQIGRKWRVPTSQFGVSMGILGAAGVPEYGRREIAPVDSPLSGLSTDHIRQSTPSPSPSPSPSSSRPYSSPQPQVARPTLRIYLLGRPQIFIDDVRVAELERSNRRRELIQLLALHREGLSAAQLATLLNMASHRYEEESLDPHYVRTLVWGARDQARKKTGWDGIIESPAQRGPGAHRYQLPDDTFCDLWEFQDRLDQADGLAVGGAGVGTGAPGIGLLSRLVQSSLRRVQGVQGVQGVQELPGWTQTREEALAEAAALREEALQLYRGDFCDGSANGCLAEAALMIEERYINSAVEQGGYWCWVARRMQEAEESYSSQMVALTTGAGETGVWGAGGAGGAGDGTVEGLVVPAVSTRSNGFIPQLQPGVRAVWREALLNYERVLKVDPYHEEACIRAMECYASLGNARGVGLTFNRYREVLETDLHQEPGQYVILAYDGCRDMLRSVRTGNP